MPPAHGQIYKHVDLMDILAEFSALGLFGTGLRRHSRRVTLANAQNRALPGSLISLQFAFDESAGRTVREANTLNNVGIAAFNFAGRDGLWLDHEPNLRFCSLLILPRLRPVYSELPHLLPVPALGISSSRLLSPAIASLLLHSARKYSAVSDVVRIILTGSAVCNSANAHEALAVNAPFAVDAVRRTAQNPAGTDLLHRHRAFQFGGELFGPHAGRPLALEQFITFENHGGVKYGCGKNSHCLCLGK